MALPASPEERHDRPALRLHLRNQAAIENGSLLKRSDGGKDDERQADGHGVLNAVVLLVGLGDLVLDVNGALEDVGYLRVLRVQLVRSEWDV